MWDTFLTLSTPPPFFYCTIHPLFVSILKNLRPIHPHRVTFLSQCLFFSSSSACLPLHQDTLPPPLSGFVSLYDQMNYPLEECHMDAICDRKLQAHTVYTITWCRLVQFYSFLLRMTNAPPLIHQLQLGAISVCVKNRS